MIISNEETIDITKISTSLEDSGILIKDVTKAMKNETKEKKSTFLGLLLYTLGASLLGKMFATPRVGITGKGVIRAGDQII